MGYIRSVLNKSSQVHLTPYLLSAACKILHVKCHSLRPFNGVKALMAKSLIPKIFQQEYKQRKIKTHPAAVRVHYAVR